MIHSCTEILPPLPPIYNCPLPGVSDFELKKIFRKQNKINEGEREIERGKRKGPEGKGGGEGGRGRGVSVTIVEIVTEIRLTLGFFFW